MIRFLAIVAILSLTACETVKGVGQDISNAGTAMDNAL
ncbi:entericidin A/B family lipoprotein [Yoonia sp.]|nr:entericidin A/B family lipoprotein [Yoonia sp.]MBE0414024.1 entericidin A/B family lipoprotein [Yoonia sp.]